jgi:hypothetical protein
MIPDEGNSNISVANRFGPPQRITLSIGGRITSLRRNQFETVRAVWTSDIISNPVVSRLHDRLAPRAGKANFFQLNTLRDKFIASNTYSGDITKNWRK